MATDKKSFILYCDLLHTVKKMPKDKAGELFLHILEYVNDLNPETDDLLVEVAFEPIKQAMKRDLKKWETEINRKSQGAILGNLKRWHFDLFEKVQSNKLTIDEAQRIVNHRKPSHSDKTDSIAIKNIASVADNVNVSVSVNDSVSDSVNDNKKEIYRSFDHLCLSLDEFNEVNKKYHKHEIDSTLDAIENYVGNKKYKSLNLTLQNWLKKEFGIRDGIKQLKKGDAPIQSVF